MHAYKSIASSISPKRDINRDCVGPYHMRRSPYTPPHLYIQRIRNAIPMDAHKSIAPQTAVTHSNAIRRMAKRKAPSNSILRRYDVRRRDPQIELMASSRV